MESTIALVLRHERQFHRLAAGRDDGLGELDDLLATVGREYLDVMRIEEAAYARQHLDLARLGHARQAAGELLDHAVLEAAQLVEVDLRRAELDAVVGQVPDLVHHRSGVQQRLRRDAADVQAHAAERRIALDEHGLHAEVGAAEGGRVAARPRAEHQHFAFDVGLAGVGGGTGDRHRRGDGSRCRGLGRRCRCRYRRGFGGACRLEQPGSPSLR